MDLKLIMNRVTLHRAGNSMIFALRKDQKKYFAIVYEKMDLEV